MYELWLLLHGYKSWSSYWLELLGVSLILGMVGILLIMYRDTVADRERITITFLGLYDALKEIVLHRSIFVVLSLPIILAITGWLFFILAMLPRKVLEKIHMITKTQEEKEKSWNST